MERAFSVTERDGNCRYIAYIAAFAVIVVALAIFAMVAYLQ